MSMGKSSIAEDISIPNSKLFDDVLDQENGTWFSAESANFDGREKTTIVEISRPIFNLETYQNRLGAKKKGAKIRDKIIAKTKEKFCHCSLSCWITVMMNLFPITKWIPKYSLKENIVADLMSGLTVGVMSIPQGMAYARLAGMPLVHGLYTNLVPTIIYVVLGTSRHAAIGAATVMSLMMGAIRYKHIPCEDCWRINPNGSANSSIIAESMYNFTPIELGTSTAFLVGVTMIIMGLVRMDIITTYLSDQIVSGFTAGAAVHIFTAQLDAVFGLHFDKSPGVGKIILDYVALFKTIHKTNVATLIISLISIVFLIILKLVINPHVQKKLKVPLPGELFVVIIGSLVSYFVKVHTRYGVKVVEHIPAELPLSMAPRFDIMNMLLLDSIILAILTYCQAVSQAKLYAKTHDYKIDTRQEFFAYGVMNTVGSFFSCFNSGMSVSRSIVYERSGAKSQIAGLIGTSVVLVTILCLAPYLEPLPQGVLAAIIIVACIDLLRQMTELKFLWKTSKYDFAIYLITFLAVVILDVSYGLLFSVLFSFFTVVMRTQCQRVVPVAHLPGTDFYDEVDKFSTVEETPGIKIVHFHAPLHYANVEKFKSTVLKICAIMSKEKELPVKRKNAISLAPHCEPIHIIIPTRHLILNCSGIVYVDLMGVNALKQIYQELKHENISTWFTHLNGQVQKMFTKTNFFDAIPKESVFIEVHDAIKYINEENKYSQIYAGQLDETLIL